MMQELHSWQSKEMAEWIDLLEFPESLQLFMKDKSAHHGSNGSDYKK